MSPHRRPARVLRFQLASPRETPVAQRKSSAPAATGRTPASNRVPRAATPQQVHQLRVALVGIRPSIWRRLQVPSSITLRQLHHVIQAAMGWTTMHLHRFTSAGKTYGDIDPQVDPPADLLDDRSAALHDVLRRAGSRLRYEYDFGDGWEHAVIVEDIRPGGIAANRALCIDGARACPPEDCGGPIAYQRELLPALANPTDPRSREMLQWVDESFDPESFDLNAVNRRLARLKVTPIPPRKR